MDDKMTTQEKITRYAVLIVFAIFFLIPMYVLISTSLKSFSEVSINTMWQLPSIYADNWLIWIYTRINFSPCSVWVTDHNFNVPKLLSGCT
ncbi:MAG: multiple sugar transport system permease protein [Halanaerobium sp.]|nr:MAG: multiple sugar transport system permease protein [Halanaerobium sp.]